MTKEEFLKKKEYYRAHPDELIKDIKGGRRRYDNDKFPFSY